MQTHLKTHQKEKERILNQFIVIVKKLKLTTKARKKRHQIFLKIFQVFHKFHINSKFIQLNFLGTDSASDDSDVEIIGSVRSENLHNNINDT
jgi:hypothetical protein